MADSSIETWTGITTLEILKIDNTQLLINKQETIGYFYSWYCYDKGLQAISFITFILRLFKIWNSPLMHDISN